MAHFAELDGDNKVIRVCVVDNTHVPSDKHADGETWCEDFWGGTWKQTSYNNNIRKNHAGIGYTYDEDKDAFIAPQPYPSWTLNETTWTWDAPIAYPDDDKIYEWDEATTNWVEVTN